MVFTIDPESSQDVEDAISIEEIFEKGPVREKSFKIIKSEQKNSRISQKLTSSKQNGEEVKIY